VLSIYTPYPSQVIGLGETSSLDINLEAGEEAQAVELEIEGLPEGWTATFRGGGEIIHSVYVKPGEETSIDLRIETPANGEPGTVNLTVIGRSDLATVEVPIELIVQEKLPPSLTFEAELPTLRGNPTTTFRFSTTLKNEGEEDLTVNLVAQAPSFFTVSFRLSGQDVTSVPLSANESKTVSIEAQPFSNVPAGSYPITVLAQGGEAEAVLELAAVVTGQPDLEVSAPDGRLSAQVNASRETPIRVIVRNTGSAPAHDIKLSSSAPNGWTVTFEPELVPEIPLGAEVEVTAKIRPADQAVAGDYVVTVRAQPGEGASQSADFRITVVTSTLWGIVGVGLVAVALGVVALAVMRFGRR
jgi:uncharacterized membrane protein